MDKDDWFFYYLPVSDTVIRRGLYVTSAGRQRTKPHGRFPPNNIRWSIISSGEGGGHCRSLLLYSSQMDAENSSLRRPVNSQFSPMR